MHIDFLLDVFRESADADAIVWRGEQYSYRWMLDRIEYWKQYLIDHDVTPGAICVLEADFSPNSVALYLSLIDRECILVPLTASVENKKPDFIRIAQGEVLFKLDDKDNVTLLRLSTNADHELYGHLRQHGHPGLVLFSSGSTGASKGAVHDFVNLLGKFKVRRQNFRTLTFLLFDHIGGVDTMLYSLSNGSCVITVEDRSPDAVLDAVEKFTVEVLPVTPTFLNLILLSHAYERYDLSSLKYITYGTEVMPESTLRQVAELFPHVKILQKYGTTEVGTLRSKSRSSDSPWVKVGGEGFDIRIVDGILQIKARQAMLGYLNAPSPFTDDGWFITGDEVLQDGEFIRFLGRKSEIINVGGEKVYPAEVESVIQELDNVAEVTVYGEKNPIVGHIVCARVTLVNLEEGKSVSARVKKHCRARLENYKVPVKVIIVDDRQHSDRFKKMRSPR